MKKTLAVMIAVAAMAMMQTAGSEQGAREAMDARVVGEKLDSGLGSMVYGESLDSGLGSMVYGESLDAGL